MKETKQQLIARLDALQSLLSANLVASFRRETLWWQKEAERLNVEMEDASKQRMHWEDCAGRLMLENEFLKSGKAGPIHDTHGPLEPKPLEPKPIKTKQRSWWSKFF